ncbi:Armadillo repeat-containing kinesin-like protein 1 [Hibiscus syriacus]|uniref:Kinesin-like protein n=1 Tax=Hibiscus syriacus TaxID=106335 RepID=A0A6A2YW53_HIBSY|nr:Armadillo repeat-containing kinesin-like protein 1 [Hibiscus syriacus]
MATASSGLRPAQRAERQRISHQQQGFLHGGNSLTRSSISGQSSVRSKDNAKPLPSPPPRRSITPHSSSHSRDFDDDNDPGRVRVAVRLRPRNAEDLSEADFADCVELHPELKRLKLRKNNWNSESYKFDEVFTETASQKRVYEVVAKPVVESVLSGYNGTVMAYGQTGTGKTFTLGRLSKDDASERGIMVRAVEDILSNISLADTVEVSYLQLYMESIQDLLAPEKTNIPINEDHKTGEVSLPGTVTVKVRDLDQFLELLQIGEANRHSANTNLNTESSRSHAILMVFIRRSVPEIVEDDISSQDMKTKSNFPLVRKSKLLIVDLAGSERLDKSGSEGILLEEAKFINLSLTSLGKCINALAENSPHIPTRDSKLTRLLRDSFGGSARTSLIITIGPSSRHHAETTSTIMFGQRAMKIVNMVKLKEEFDYESLCRKLETQVDHLTAEIDREQKLREKEKNDLQKQLKDCCDSLNETRKNLVTRSEKVLADTTQMYEKKIAELIKQLQVERAKSGSVREQLDAMKKLSDDHKKLIQQHEMENSKHQKALADTTQMYEKKLMELTKQLEDEHTRFEGAQEQLDLANMLLTDYQNSTQGQEEASEMKLKLEEMYWLHESTVNELQSLKAELKDQIQEKEAICEKLNDVQEKLSAEEKRRKAIEYELINLKKSTPECDKDFEDKKSYMKENTRGTSMFGTSASFNRSGTLRATQSSQRATIAKIFGLQKIIQLLTSEDTDVQIHAVKVIANLAAEDVNQATIVEEGGLDALLTMLRSSQNATVLRVASGAIANLAMNEMNQGLIVSKGGAQLLAKTASEKDDPQTLRMVAGALANLCGNEKLHEMLKEDGGIKALLGMVRSGNSDVVAQVARGLANFAKCESRAIVQGHRKGRSLLMEECALEWLIANCNIASASTRRHVELALCHLAQNEDNAKDFLSIGGLRELQRISMESSREDICDLAKKMLKSNMVFQGEMRSGWH